MLIKAILIGIFCYLGALSVPWAAGVTGGWYTLSRPLVSGMIVGLILGDVTKGIVIGVAVQAVYIALITPGGTMPADLNFVAYPAIALGILSGASTEVAVTLAATIGILGSIIHNFMMVVNSFWNHRGDKAVEEGDMRGVVMSNAVYPQITTFIMRFVPTVLAVYLGAQYIKGWVDATPQLVIDIMMVLGGMLPAIGIAILLKQIIKDNSMLIYFLAGFVALTFIDNIIIITIIGLVLALIHFKYSPAPQGQGEEEVL